MRVVRVPFPHRISCIGCCCVKLYVYDCVVMNVYELAAICHEIVKENTAVVLLDEWGVGLILGEIGR